MDQSAAIDKLLGKEEIRDAMGRYCRGIDRRDAALVRSTYHEDSHDQHGYGLNGSGWDLANVAERGNPAGFPKEWYTSQHFIGTMLIDVADDVTTAYSETYFQGWSRYEHEGDEYDVVAYGRYVDRWERRGGGPFKISDRSVIYDFNRTDKVTTWPGPDTSVAKMYFDGPSLDPTGTYFGSLGPDDESYRHLAYLSDES